MGTVETPEETEPPRDAAPAGTVHRQRVAFCRSADGTGIAYATSGEGYPLLKAGHWLTHLEHDWNSPIWAPQLERLSKSFRFVRFDQRGNGLSDWDVPEFTFDGMIDDTQILFEVGSQLANSDAWPNWYDGNEFRSLRDAQLADGG